MTLEQEYGGGQGMPLVGLATVAGTFAALFGGLLWCAHRRGRLPTELPSVKELVCLGVASHKAARTLAHDQVLAPLRAPFVRYVKGLGKGAVKEEPRGDGVQRAIGELSTCPYCSGFWVAAGAATGYLLAPRLTRAVATSLCLSAGVDVLNVIWYRYAA
ncbi:MAG: DUF1360 domain-containing protein [Vulcanimicrobiota bacterium]